MNVYKQVPIQNVITIGDNNVLWRQLTNGDTCCKTH